MIRSPKLDEDNGLVTFFANSFTCNNFKPGTNLFWIPTNFEDLLKSDCTRFSVQSVGAMALARLQRSPYYYREAQRNYGLALLSLANVWNQQSGVDKDNILFTILFLSFFEVLASYDSNTRESFLAHLRSLGTLLGRRDEQFFRSSLGARMLFQSRAQAITDALRNKAHVPEMYQKQLPPLSFALPPQMLQTNKADILMIRLATLQAHCQSLQPSHTMVSELITLGEDLSQWTADLPSFWAFSAQKNAYHSGWWWDVRSDVYPSPIIAHVWNKVRAARILTEDLIQEQLLYLSILEADELSSQTLQTRSELYGQEMQRLVTDICATIPNYYRPPKGFGDPHKAGIPPHLGTTYWLLLPIEVVGCMRDAPAELREWLLQCLDRIYTTTGIIKAQVAAERLRRRH